MESGVAAIEVISYHAGITGRMDGLDRTRQTVFAIRTANELCRDDLSDRRAEYSKHRADLRRG